MIGAGAVGLACALELQAAGAEVVLVDPQRPEPSPSYGNAGRIATEFAEPLTSFKTLRTVPRRLALVGGALDLVWRDLDFVAPWAVAYLRACAPSTFRSGTAALGDLLEQAIPAWRRMLRREGADHLLRCEGHYLLWDTPASARRRLEAWSRMDTGPARFRRLEREERERFAALLRRAPADGVKVEGTGQVSDPQALMQTLLAAFERSGGARRRDAAIAIRNAHGARVRVVLASGDMAEGDHVVIAAGAFSQPLLADVGERAPLIAERGYHLHFAEHAWPTELPTTTFEDRAVVATAFASGLRVTSNIEFGRPQSPPDPAKWRRLERHVRDLGLPAAGEPSRWMGARPTLPDYVPAIGRCRKAPKVLYAFGHQHLGLTLAAATGRAIAALAQGDPPPAPLERFSLSRFG